MIALITNTSTDLEDETYGMFDYYCNEVELNQNDFTAEWQVAISDNNNRATKCNT